jgi:SRSO17 transposase
MDAAAFEELTAVFAAFHARFAPLFGRTETREHSGQYLRGLLVQQGQRRNAENLAEAIEGVTVRELQRFLTEAPWPTRPVVNHLQAGVAAQLNHPEGVFVFDESGFPKQGRHSVGVARQYCGALGKTANCQIGVFLAYVSDRGHALVDAQLWLPEAWTADTARRERAGVPAAITYQSKAEIALALRRQARAAGHLTGRWVTGDEEYGKAPWLRDTLHAEGDWYVFEVPSTTPVFTQPVETAVPVGTGRGRPPTRARLVPGEPGPVPVAAVAAGVAPGWWQPLTVDDGAQGPRQYQFVGRHVWESRDGLPGRAAWLVLRRNRDGSELKYYLSNAPAATPLAVLGRVGARRWPIETELQTGKSHLGLAEYEVRSWRGWHHHITLCLLANLFLLELEQAWGEKHARSHSPASRPGAGRTPAAAALDPGRPAPLARADPGPQRRRQVLPRPTSAAPPATSSDVVPSFILHPSL